MAQRTRKVVRQVGAGTRWEDVNWLRNLPTRIGAVGILTYGDAIDEDTFDAHCELGNMGAIMWDGLVRFIIEDEFLHWLSRIQQRKRATFHIAQIETIWIREVDGGDPPID